MIKLGDKVKDRISGFEGTVTAEHRYLNGCVRVSISSNALKDGLPTDPQAFDIEQVDLLQSDQHSLLKRTGGPEKATRRPSVPAR